jgi:hypothetical protein
MISLIILGAIGIYCARKMLAEKWDGESLNSTTSYERY